MPPEYFTLAQLADSSGLSVDTLRRAMRHPTHPLPFYRVGRRVLVKRSDFDDWLQRLNADERAAVDQRADRVGQIVDRFVRGS